LCRGYAEYKLGLIQAAISDFDEACKSAPNDFQCFEYRAAAYQTIKRYRKAIADYKIALEKLPNERNVQSKLYGELGMCYLAFGELAEAQISLRRAIELVPNRATLYAALATADLHLAETDRCIKDASQAIALDTNNAQAYQVRSRAYGALAQTELSKSDELSARKLFAAELEREYK